MKNNGVIFRDLNWENLVRAIILVNFQLFIPITRLGNDLSQFECSLRLDSTIDSLNLISS
jgi:hypothetical protein